MRNAVSMSLRRLATTMRGSSPRTTAPSA